MIILLCAEDFGLSEGVNNAIEKLVRQGIPGAVSCLPISDLWPRSASRLTTLLQTHPKLKLGASIRLTGNFSPLSAGFAPDNATTEGNLPDLEDLEKAVWRGSLDEGHLESEFRAQLRRFSAHAQRSPDFILLESAHLKFGIAAKAVTRAMNSFDLNAIPMLCPKLATTSGIRNSFKARFVYKSALHEMEHWNRRTIRDIFLKELLPDRSSWHADEEIWATIKPALKDDRLHRFDPYPQDRWEQLDWFLQSNNV